MSDLSNIGLQHARTLPHSTQSEQSVLGCLLMDSSCFDAVGPVLVADDFYHPEHRGIFATVAELVQAGKVADVITVFERGGHDLGELNALAMCVASTRSAGQYAATVRDLSVRRQVIEAASDLAESVYLDMQRKHATHELIDAAMVKLLALMAGRQARQPKVVADLLPGFLDKLEDRAQGRVDAVATGLHDLDKLTGGGLRRGELVTIGARTSMGKSALSSTMARNAAGMGYTVLVCSMEDSEDMLVARHVAAAGRVNLADIRAPQRAPDVMWSGVSDGVDTMMPLPLWIDEQPSLSLADVRRKVAQVQRKAGKLDLVVVDYLQLMQGDGDTRAQVLGSIAAGLKSAAKEYGVVVVLLSQLSREADKLDGPPRLEHLKESGGIEEASDIVMLLWREYKRKPKPELKHKAQLELAKHKNGPTDTVLLHFDGATQRFSDWTAGDSYAG